MAAVSFSVPDEVKEAFDEAFTGRDKSAVIADLIRKAVEWIRSAESGAVTLLGGSWSAATADHLCQMRRSVPRGTIQLPVRSPRARNQASTCPKASCCH